jgi:hypothetical protein
MDARERLATARFKVEWAEQHINHLDIEVRRFLDAEPGPYTVGIKPYPETGQRVHYIAKIEDVPLSISALAGDALHSLRSSLDHLAYQLWLMVAKDTSGGGRHVNFPVFACSDKYKAGRQRLVEVFGNETARRFDEVEPYKGGRGEPLWRLNELDNTDKHRLLIAAGSYVSSYDPLALFLSQEPTVAASVRSAFPDFRLRLRPMSHVFPLKVGDILTPAPAEPYQNPDLTFDIAFNEPGIAEGEPVLELVQQTAQFVSGVLDKFSPFLGGHESSAGLSPRE